MDAKVQKPCRAREKRRSEQDIHESLPCMDTDCMDIDYATDLWEWENRHNLDGNFYTPDTVITITQWSILGKDYFVWKFMLNDMCVDGKEASLAEAERVSKNRLKLMHAMCKTFQE